MMLFLSRLQLLFNSPDARLLVCFWGVLLPFFCYISLWALGRGDVRYLGYSLILFLTLYVLRVFSVRVFLCYLWLTFIVSFCYLPEGSVYGKLNLGIVISLYETNGDEAWEYIQGTPLKVYLSLMLYALLFYALLKTHHSLRSPVRAKWHYALLFLVVMAMTFQPARYFYKRGAHVSNLRVTKVFPLKFLFTHWDYYNIYNTQKRLIEYAQKVQPTWEVRASKPKYRNYVLVIGESMRRDYTSVYGYPIDTTPFLKTVNGVFLNNYSSPSYNTPLSLQRMLIQQTKPESFIYSNTAITLAQSAGFKTFWLANQGIFGTYNSITSSVAMRADNTYFAKKGNYQSNTTSDLELLPELDKALVGDTEPRLIVLHLVGSHPTFCKRLDDSYQVENITHVINDEISCYLSTFRQTDKFLEKIYTRLQATNEPFSIMYFSDHGLARVKKALQSVTLKHNNDYYQNYDVPFIVMSSDDRARTVITAPKSGYDFIVGFAEWLGIDEASLADKPPFFSNQSHGDIKMFDGQRVRNYESLDDDPVILP